MKIICIGRNYAAHAAELGNPVPERPVVFMKPATALLVNDKPFYYPDFTEDLHYEAEIVLKIAKNGRHVLPEFAATYFDEIGLGIDFTARDLQQTCKKQGHPWEIAKGFDGSAPVGQVYPKEQFKSPSITFELKKNGKTVQQGDTADLLFSFEEIIAYVSSFFKLQIGDMIFTGTPAGVGAVSIGDTLEGYLYFSDGPKKVLHCDIR